MIQKWPTCFFTSHWAHHNKEAASIIEHLYKEKNRSSSNISSEVAPKAKSEEGLFESKFDLLGQKHSGLKRLKSFCTEAVQHVVSRFNGNQFPPSSIRVNIHESWFHITNDGGFHDAHGHPNCSWCGIYYLQLGDSGSNNGKGAPNGANRFYLPLSMGGYFSDYGNSYLGRCLLDPPLEEGMLLLFPSYLLHSALPYSGGKDRIIIAFNSQSYA